MRQQKALPVEAPFRFSDIEIEAPDLPSRRVKSWIKPSRTIGWRACASSAWRPCRLRLGHVGFRSASDSTSFSKNKSDPQKQPRTNSYRLVYFTRDFGRALDGWRSRHSCPTSAA
jgi:hypothetical protein